ncbi:MAG: cobalt ECF transporter T component CbiQ [Holophagales bacterium]|nr:cobalt ECF transporter T component CbiQ [Holophagales bacterium]
MASLYHAAAGINRLEQLAMQDSPVHRLHPMAKLIVTFFYVVTIVSFPPEDISGIIPFLLYPAVMMPLSGTPYRPLLQRLMFALPFSLMGGISNLIAVRGVAFYIGSFVVSQGMVSFVSIMLKTLLSVFAVLILIASTSFVEISCQLTILRIPKIICLQLVMTYRYLSILISETASMLTAYSFRGPNQKGIKMKDMGSFAGRLILRSFDRAERVYQAMKCRGFNGIYYGRKHGGFRLSDGIFIALMTLLVIFLRFFNLSLFFGRLAG